MPRFGRGRKEQCDRAVKNPAGPKSAAEFKAEGPCRGTRFVPDLDSVGIFRVLEVLISLRRKCTCPVRLISPLLDDIGSGQLGEAQDRLGRAARNGRDP